MQKFKKNITKRKEMAGCEGGTSYLGTGSEGGTSYLGTGCEGGTSHIIFGMLSFAVVWIFSA